MSQFLANHRVILLDRHLIFNIGLGSISIEIIRKEAPRGTKKSETDDRQSDSSSGSSSDESDENEPTLPEEESIENIPPQEPVPQK